jgi:uncharacterized protein
MFMIYGVTKVKIATDFADFFPKNHQNTLLYRTYRSYGGAQTRVLMLRVKHGDIYNYKTLKKIQDISSDVDRLPGVNHQEVFSLSSYREAYAEAVPGGLDTKPYMYPDVPKAPAAILDLKKTVAAHHEALRQLISEDGKETLITASFNEEGLDYKELFDGIQAIAQKYQDADTDIYLAGEPIVRGYGYHYLSSITACFFFAVLAMIILLYISLGHRSRWWAPTVTGTLSAVWGLGFVGWMGYNFDPVMLVIPFILTARDLSHGIQWQGRYYDELDRLDDKLLACATTTDVMLPPGLLSILADIAGIIFISFGGIPVLKEIGVGGAVWLAASLTMVFVFQPIFMSFLPRPRIRQRASAARSASGRPGPFHAFIDWLVHVPVKPGGVRTLLLAGGAIFIVFGIISGQRARIGYETPGTPLYKPDSKVNRDIAEIGKFFPTDVGWVVLSTPDYPNPQSSLGPAVLRATDDLGPYLQSRGDALAVVSFSSQVIKPLNMMFHNGYPKFWKVPSGTELGGNLWYLFFAGTAPGEMERFFAYSPRMTNTCVRVMLPDHTYTRLNRLRDDIRTFVATRITPDPNLSKVSVRYLGGEAGLYLAANDTLYKLDIINLTFVLGVIFLCCAFTFRSPVAGLLFIISCVMANFGAFIYMNARNIGLTIDTIPVISLGIGLGVDYGIYIVARIRDEVIGGATIDEGIITALRSTGASVFSTFAVMIGGILPWAFSPLLFHNEMSVLLIFLMATNMIAGVLILPSYIAWRRPRFIAQFEKPADAPRTAAAR